ncbi:MAG: RNA polymerase sigma-54 factor, partial [Dethiobacteria bacterium]|nr:RNA polymerase sigma-54 factor [Dethiobacteria bacterium]
MKLDYTLKLEQTQKLIITPELKLAITLLQYSALELQDHIQEELLNNPVLEIQEPKEVEQEEGSEPEAEKEIDEAQTAKDDFPWEEYFRDMDLDTSSYSYGKVRDLPDYQPTVENCAGSTCTMLEDLLGQLRMMSLSEREYVMASYLAGNLDHNGYLQGEVEELAIALGVGLDKVEEALKLVQKLEPAGIGCRNLQECLMLQLGRIENAPPLALEIVRNYLP